MKNEKFHTIRAVPISNLKFVETDKMYTQNTHMYDCSFSAGAWHRHFNKKCQD
jgi:hypothetical protein